MTTGERKSQLKALLSAGFAGVYRMSPSERHLEAGQIKGFLQRFWLGISMLLAFLRLPEQRYRIQQRQSLFF